MMSILTALLLVFELSNVESVSKWRKCVRPNAADPDGYVTVDLENQTPNGPNAVSANNEWVISNPIKEWGIVVTLDAERYGFRAGQVSSIQIEMDMTCENQCDGMYAFSIGDQVWSTLMNDFDGGLWGLQNKNKAGTGGIFAYPECNALKGLVSGDASGLLDHDTGISWDGIRNQMSENNDLPMLSATRVHNNFPVIFEFINDDQADTFTVKFTQAQNYANGITCTYAGAAPTCLDFKFYQSPDAGETNHKIKSYTVTSDNTASSENAACGGNADCCDGLICCEGRNVCHPTPINPI